MTNVEPTFVYTVVAAHHAAVDELRVASFSHRNSSLRAEYTVGVITGLYLIRCISRYVQLCA